MAKKRKAIEVCDSEGNIFRVKGFTYNRQGAVNGFYLSSDHGDKEVPLSEAKFFKQCRTARRSR